MMMRRIFVVIAISVLAFGALTAHAGEITPAGSSEREQFEDALMLFDTGAYINSASTAERLAASFPESEWVGRALFLAARAKAQLADRHAVDAAIAAAIAKYPILADYLLYLTAEDLYGSGEFAGASAYYHRLISEYPDSPLVDNAMLKAAAAAVKTDNGADASSMLEQLLARKPGRDKTSRAHLMLMELEFAAGDYVSAEGRYRQLWLEYPGSDAEKDARSMPGRLEAAGHAMAVFTANDYITRAGREAGLGRNNGAAKDYETALGMLPEADPREGPALLGLGTACYIIRENSKAASALERVRTGENFAMQAPEAMYWLAKTYLRTGEQDRFREVALECSERFVGSARAADCLYLLGAEYTFDGEYESAVGVYTYMADAYAGYEDADGAQWRLGWAEFLRGNYAGADAAFAKMLSTHPGSPLAAQAIYWRARSLEMSGDSDRAKSLYMTLRTDYGLSYYSYIAESPAADIMADGVYAPADGGTTYEVIEQYRDSTLARSYELGVQGLNDLGKRELRIAESRYSGSTKDITSLAALYAMLGEYRRPLEMCSSLYSSRMSDGRSSVSAESLRIMFPLGFWEVIRDQAVRFGVDPFLVASLVRQESHYDPAAVSPAGAVGLMQLMPTTAAAVCRKLGMPSPTSGKLQRGTYNVPVGTCHLGYLIEKHGGRLVYALAEYNAGPTALAKWKAKLPDAPDDLFVEAITYAETRNYVKHVLRNYKVYRELYGIKVE